MTDYPRYRDIERYRGDAPSFAGLVTRRDSRVQVEARSRRERLYRYCLA